MASITCEINIANEFRDTKFFLFQEVPQAKNGPSGEVFSNIYQVTEKNQAQRDGSSTIQFQMDNTFYALFGSKSGQGGDTRVNTSSFKKVKLGPDGTVVAITDKAGAFVWDDASSAGKKAPNEGGFQFITDDTIPTDTGELLRGILGQSISDLYVKTKTTLVSELPTLTTKERSSPLLPILPSHP